MERRFGLWLFSLTAAVATCTLLALRPLPKSLLPDDSGLKRIQYLDRAGRPLSYTYENSWNYQAQIELYRMPEFLKMAFIQAEDQRFYQHRGNDWLALASAIYQNVKNLRVVRGGSTISEQVVRLLHPRGRNIWSRWLEMWEARGLERRFSKAQILEFYLNQVPYAQRRRGVQEAASILFDRDLDTLNRREMLALAVLVRSPAKLDPRHVAQKSKELLSKRVDSLLNRLELAGQVSAQEKKDILAEELELRDARPPLEASHFLRFVSNNLGDASHARYARARTSLDSEIQGFVQKLLDTRVKSLKKRQVANGAALVVDNESQQILAWVNAWPSGPNGQIDAVLTARQPGSTLKPFLYALAIQDGWTPATIIEDAPLPRAVGVGLKSFRNYSGSFYGAIRLREALGNSLNIPAVQTVSFVGRGAFYDFLHRLGFETLNKHPDFYGEGLALGNGEVRLYDLVRAYSVLAQDGVLSELNFLLDSTTSPPSPKRLISADVSSLIANILSDPSARQHEFGQANLLNFPAQTAVKTGTSSDYRDAWAIGYSARYTAGVWMGNLDRTPMLEVTGSSGPAVVLRAIFAKLESRFDSQPLKLSQNLVSRKICRISGKLARDGCPVMDEWFLAQHVPTDACAIEHGNSKEVQVPTVSQDSGPRLELPTPGLTLALDPRIPDNLEAFPLTLAPGLRPHRTQWFVDDVLVGSSREGERKFMWPLKSGQHSAYALVWLDAGQAPHPTERVNFVVKGRG